jgi:hypothetical protein
MEKEAINKALSEFTGVKRDYFDLNAMHEAEMLLETRTPIRAYGYVLELEAAILRAANIKPNGHVGDYRKITAPAAQRAEALLRTIGKWQTEKEPTK